MKRAAEKADAEVLKKEDSKRIQDLYVNRLVERMDRLREDIAMFDAQLEAQASDIFINADIFIYIQWYIHIFIDIFFKLSYDKKLYNKFIGAIN